MKWTILVGILGLASGFLVGRSQERVLENEASDAVVKSERRVGNGGGPRREGRGPGGRGLKGGKTVLEAALMSESLSKISRARLAKWILELEVADFPEVLEELKKVKSSEEPDPFARIDANHDSLTLAMARWYELEGEMVLDWILAKPEILGEMRAGELMADLIADGYEKDPMLSFQLFNKHGEVLKGESGGAGVFAAWHYGVARWSQNLAADYAELREMEFGPVWSSAVGGDPDPFASGDFSTTEESFVRGIIESGRAREARDLFEGSDSSILAKLDAALEKQKVSQLEEGGWQGVRAGMESGELSGTMGQAAWVLDRWGLEEPEAAVEWFLEQRDEDVSREEQIRGVLGSAAFYTKRDGIRLAEIDLDRAMEFLGRMETQGEPTDKGWTYLTGMAGELQQWDDLVNLQPRVSAEDWEMALEYVRSSATRAGSLRLGPGDWMMFSDVSEANFALLDRFGIREQVLQSIKATNEESLRQLQEKLGNGTEMR